MIKKSDKYSQIYIGDQYGLIAKVKVSIYLYLSVSVEILVIGSVFIVIFTENTHVIMRL